MCNLSNFSPYLSRIFTNSGIFVWVLTLYSCSYQPVQDDRYIENVRLTEIEGDHRGIFRNALAHHLNALGITASQHNAQYLSVTLSMDQPKNIGFEREKNSDGDILDTIVPNATACALEAKVTLINPQTQTSYSQVIVHTSTFDYTPEPSYVNTGELSMGFLQPKHLAQEESANAHYDALAYEVSIWVKSRLLSLGSR